MNKSKIRNHFDNQFKTDIAKIVDSYSHAPALFNVFQDSITDITESVIHSFMDSLTDLVKTGDDPTNAIHPKEFCNQLAAMHLASIIKLCPDCDAPHVRNRQPTPILNWR